MITETFPDCLFSLSSQDDFNSLALEVFNLQATENTVYGKYVRTLGIDPASVKTTEQIPFLPIEFFKSHTIITGGEDYDCVFTSSGTANNQLSRHYVKDIKLYEAVFEKIFMEFYGNVSEYSILALLPSYLERTGSSLIHMVDNLIRKSGKTGSGFFLKDTDKLLDTLQKRIEKKEKTILFGVTYALLDFVANYRIFFPDLIVMETGGMKGRRKELIRQEVHEKLCEGFGVARIHSEYGMTELLSQAYSQGEGLFRTPRWMKVLIRDTYDPFSIEGYHATGGINVIDLANIHSCSFIATQDLGKVYPEGTFEVLGRFDFSDVRGCNLMAD